ncbi:MAG: cation:proton antiporter [Candidatus Nanoarchaeia archaeon]
MEIFAEIGIMIIVATLGAYIAKLFKQPITPAYILAGVLMGPVFGIVNNLELIGTLSEIGIAFLLFIVGLELNFKRMKDVGNVSTFGGVIQVVLSFLLGFALATLLGFSMWGSVYLGLVLAFSSTMIVVKLLSDKKELDTLHGRIILGILLMQDVLAILALSVLTTTKAASLAQILILLAEGGIIVAIAILFSKHIFPIVFKFAAKSQELLLMVALSVCFLFALLFELIGFSIIIGAFVAGVALANLPYNLEIIGKVKSLRDFFAIIFFTALGLQLATEGILGMLVPLAIFTIYVIVAKLLIIMFTCAIFGYTERTSFLTSIGLSQISEFSLIIVAQGLVLGHISQEVFTLTTLLAIITMTLTAYAINFEYKIYLFLSKKLFLFKMLPFTNPSKLEYLPEKVKYDVILCGYDRVGYSILTSLVNGNKVFLVVDFNPDVIKALIKRKIPCMYGDISDGETLDRLHLEHTQLLVSTVTKFEDNLMLLKKAKKENPVCTVYVTASQIGDALGLYSSGADYVILPHFLGGEKASSILEDLEINKHKKAILRAEHILELKKRMDMGHEHPAGHAFDRR